MNGVLVVDDPLAYGGKATQEFHADTAEHFIRRRMRYAIFAGDEELFTPGECDWHTVKLNGRTVYEGFREVTLVAEGAILEPVRATPS